MEPQTRFDLNQALVDWRRDLSQQPGMGREEVRELEAHLADSVARLQSAGLSDKEAFHVAARRLGTTDQIASEFAEANPSRVWTDRVFWMTAGIAGFHALEVLFGSLTNVLHITSSWAYRTSYFLFPVVVGALALTVAFRGLPKWLSNRASRWFSKGSLVASLGIAYALYVTLNIVSALRFDRHLAKLVEDPDYAGPVRASQFWTNVPAIIAFPLMGLVIMALLLRRMNHHKVARQ